MARESSWDQLIEEVKGERVVVAEDMLGFAVIAGTQDEIVESSHRPREADPGLGTEQETFVMNTALLEIVVCADLNFYRLFKRAVSLILIQ